MQTKNQVLIAVCIVAFGFQQLSCSKTENRDANCLTVMMPDTLRFSILDKETKKDLVFSSGSIYEAEDIQVIRKIAGELKPGFPIIKEGKTPHFYILASSAEPVDTLYMQIGDQPMDTITYSIKKDKEQPCPTYILDQVRFNKENPERNAHGRIVPFYKKE
ncbi:hypothetical protein [Parapedobacter sp. 10938]|uniref:hypothetical protein n=1 Tax=Parapedobacter flavus TaxID=3110225 RepID=UPI002DBBB334|nr:hypothetical protein [Parapedobacter sp. 10938]MEC3881783.1 hypothetical protein [Parapedobacter sp. 10938]